MTRRRITWSTVFVATLLGSTGLHLAAVITAQAGAGPATSAVPPPLQGAALGPDAYPVDMWAPQTPRPELIRAETTETTTADHPTEAPAPVLAEMRARQPIRLFPAWLYGDAIRRAALPSSAGDAWARAEAILTTETTAAAAGAGDRPAQPFETVAPPFAADTRARQPIGLFPAGLYEAATRHAAVPDFAAEALARSEGISTEMAAAAPRVGDQPAQPVVAAALPVTADMRTRQPTRLFPTGPYGGVIRHAALPSSAGDALARAEALLATGTAAGAPQVRNQPAQPVQAAALPAVADMSPRPLFSAALSDPVTHDPALPDRRHPTSPAHAVLPEPLTVVLDPSRTEVDTAQVFADSRPLASADLDELRGGVFDVDGWKIAFGVNIDVKFDQDFKISTFLNPVTNRGGFALNVRDKVLVRNEDGSIRTEGNPAITSGPNGRRIDFGDFVANVREANGGFDLSADGERPVELSQTPAQVVQVVGSEHRTLARHQLSPGQIIAQLNNVQNNGRASSLATIAIDILNHDERVGVSRTLQHAEHLNRLIVRDLMGRIGR